MCLMVTGYFYWQRHHGEITKPWKAALELAWHQCECRSYKAAMWGVTVKPSFAVNILNKAVLIK